MKEEWDLCDDARRLWQVCRKKIHERKKRLLACRLATVMFPGLITWQRGVIAIVEGAAGDPDGIKKAALAASGMLRHDATVVDEVIRFLARADGESACEKMVCQDGRAWGYNSAHFRLTNLKICRCIKEIWEGPEPVDRGQRFYVGWNRALIPEMASQIYAQREWGLMPVLGDMLEEVGWGGEEMLNHCRGMRPCHCGKDGLCRVCKGAGWRHDVEHSLGCWVLDDLLGIDK